MISPVGWDGPAKGLSVQASTYAHGYSFQFTDRDDLTNRFPICRGGQSKSALPDGLNVVRVGAVQLDGQKCILYS